MREAAGGVTHRAGPALAALIAFLGAAGLLQLFMTYDWGRGAARAGLLLALAALVAALHRWPRVESAPRSWGLVAAAVVVALAAWHLAIGTVSLARAWRTGELRLDQGVNTVRAVRMLLDGGNPYGARTLLDPAEYQIQLRRWRGRRDCVEFAPSGDDPFPTISDDPACTGARRDWSSLAYKYGPVMLATYMVPVTALGEAGIYAAHLALFAALLAVLGRMTMRAAGGDLFLAALPLGLVLLPSHYRHNALDLSAADLAPVLLALGSLALRARPALAGALLGMSIGAKLFPGVLFVPLLLSLPRRAWIGLATTLLAALLPFAVRDFEGMTNNLILFGLRRPTDSTALAHFLSPGAGALLRLTVGAVLLGLVVRLHRRGWPERGTLSYLAWAHLGALLAGRVFHNNYLLWLPPVLGLALLLELGPPVARASGVGAESGLPRSRSAIQSAAPPHRPK